jgi:hypothetical protein
MHKRATITSQEMQARQLAAAQKRAPGVAPQPMAAQPGLAAAK